MNANIFFIHILNYTTRAESLIAITIEISKLMRFFAIILDIFKVE